MGSAWTNDELLFLVIPTGATSGARIAINVDQSGAILVYNAAGQLFESIAAAGGTDPFGNTYGAGFIVGVPDHPQVVITTGGDGRSGLIFFPTGSTHIHNSGALQAFQQNGSGTASYDQLQIIGPQDSVQLDNIISTWLSSSNDGTQQAQLQEYYSDPSGTLHLYRIVDFAGQIINAATITGVHPGTGTTRANAAVAETWQTPALGTGWATGDQAAGYWPLQYRMQPDGSVWLFGEIHSTSATPAATLFTLGTGYFSTVNLTKVPIVQNVTTTSSANEAVISLAGAVTLNAAVTATATSIVFDCLIRVS